MVDALGAQFFSGAGSRSGSVFDDLSPYLEVAKRLADELLQRAEGLRAAARAVLVGLADLLKKQRRHVRLLKVH